MRKSALTLMVMLALAGCDQSPKDTTTAVEQPAQTGAPADSTAKPAYDVLNKTLGDLRRDLDSGAVSSLQLVQAYVAHANALEKTHGIAALVALNPDAEKIATALDEERKQKGARGPLHGIPVLLKDNIESADAMPTTAGSLALKDNVTGRDAPLVKRLRDAGAIILGKTNLSEWANFRSSHSSSGWSAVGQQTRNPHSLDRSTCGSSSGSGAAVAAFYAPIAIGTETDGSIVCPSAINGITGIKPTLGLVSRTHIVPISHSQDTAGPMALTVADAAAVLNVIAGSDPADAATAEADQRKRDYTAGLANATLKGKRLGVMKFATGYHAALDTRFNAVLDDLRNAGVELVEIEKFPEEDELGKAEYEVLLYEFKADLNAYLASTPAAVSHRTLADLIRFNNEHGEAEMPYFGQEIFLMADKKGSLEEKAYKDALATSKRLAREQAIDKWLTAHKLDALIAPTTSPAWRIDNIIGDHYTGSSSTLAAVAGYPSVTVPMGNVHGLPVGISFIASAWQDDVVINLAHAFEQAFPARITPEFRSGISE